MCGEVNTSGGELSPKNPCNTRGSLAGLIGDKLLRKLEKGDS